MNQRSDTGGRDIVLGQGLVPIPERLLLAHARGKFSSLLGLVSQGPQACPTFAVSS